MKKYLVIILLLTTSLNAYSQVCTNSTGIDLNIDIPVSLITVVQIDITIGSNSNIPDMTITYEGQAAVAISGSSPVQDSASGTLSEVTANSSSIQLTLTKLPEGQTPMSVFSPATSFIFKVSNLEAASDISYTISSYDWVDYDFNGDPVVATPATAVSTCYPSNTAPVANFTPEPPGTNWVFPHSETFTSASTDTEDDAAALPLDLSWEITRDGAAGVLSSGIGSTIAYTFNLADTYHISLTATDSGSGFDTEIKDYVIVDEAPVANFTPGPPGSLWDFPHNAQIFTSTSTDNNNNIINAYSWNITRDGIIGSLATGTGSAITYSFTIPDTYHVSLQVTDSGSSTDTETKDYVIINSPPLTPMLSPDEIFGRSPLEVNFDGTGSDDPNGNLVSYNWDFGDLKTESNPGSTVTHNYLTGVYTATLETEDDLNLTSILTADTQVYAASNERIYFPKHIGLPYDWLPPDIDGTVSGDTGWRGAYQVIHAGGTSADMVFQGLSDKSANFLYHSFQIYDENGFGDSDDLIVLGYRVDQTLSNSLVPVASDRLLFIFPFKSDFGNGTTYTVKVYDHNGTNWVELANSLPGFEIGTDNSVTNQWTVEMRIPTDMQGTIWNTLNDDFLFTYYVFNTLGGGLVFERHWPRDVSDITGYAATPAGNNFSPFWWGLASKGSTAVRNGIGFKDYSDIGILSDPGNPETSMLTGGQVPVLNGQPVNFGARVTNYSVKDLINVSGDPEVQGIEVDDILVRFKMANWGIADPTGAGGWNEIGIGNTAPVDLGITTDNPDTMSSIPAPAFDSVIGITSTAGTAVLEWTPNAEAETAYNPGPGRLYTYHQCFYAEIVNDEDMASNLIVFNRSTHRNMNFGTASVFEQPAQINPKGFGDIPEGQEKHRFLLQVIKKTWEENKDPDSNRTVKSSENLGGRGGNQSGDIESYIQWEAKAFIYTGENVIINETEYELLESAGSFGSIVSHDALVVDWNYKIDGADKVDYDQFIVELDSDEIKELIIRIEPKEYYPWSISIHGGTTTPLGNYATGQNTGFNVSADLGYRFSKTMGLKLYGGYNQFTKNQTPPPYMISINLDFQYLYPFSQTLGFYIQAGPGLYIDDSNQYTWGYNAGMGVNYNVNKHILLSLGTDYHSDFDSSYMFANVNLGCSFLF